MCRGLHGPAGPSIVLAVMKPEPDLNMQMRQLANDTLMRGVHCASETPMSVLTPADCKLYCSCSTKHKLGSLLKLPRKGLIWTLQQGWIGRKRLYRKGLVGLLDHRALHNYP